MVNREYHKPANPPAKPGEKVNREYLKPATHQPTPVVFVDRGPTAGCEKVNREYLKQR